MLIDESLKQRSYTRLRFDNARDLNVFTDDEVIHNQKSSGGNKEPGSKAGWEFDEGCEDAGECVVFEKLRARRGTGRDFIGKKMGGPERKNNNCGLTRS